MNDEPPRSFSLLIKPVSYRCNLDCRYCFYLGKSALFGNGSPGMDFPVLEKTIREFFACPMPHYSFAWQGGEPTLAGVDFFRSALDLQRRYGRGKDFSNALQTNGTLLDDEWGTFLREGDFLTGVSLDGPATVHDRFRRSSGGRGSHAAAARGVKILQKHGVRFNTLSVISQSNRRFPLEVYDYLRDLDCRFMQYIECVEFTPSGAVMPYSLRPGEWGEFMCRVFDRWYAEDVGRISVRLFDSVVSRLVSGIPAICSMGADCRAAIVVEHDGSLYPCDFYVEAERRLGNVGDGGFRELIGKPEYRDWCAEKTPPPLCGNCRFRLLCMGDCPRLRRNGLSMLCEDWRIFYSHSIERFEELASRVENGLIMPGLSGLTSS